MIFLIENSARELAVSLTTEDEARSQAHLQKKESPGSKVDRRRLEKGSARRSSRSLGLTRVSSTSRTMETDLVNDEQIEKRRLDAWREAHQANGVAERQSRRMTDFYQTPEGREQRQKYRDLYRGKARPPEVTEKARLEMRAYWDSPEGWERRQEISAERSEGLDNVPYGPGWKEVAEKVRERDQCCQICGGQPTGPRSRLDVHHIHRRRKFGYVPGLNHNYFWANHLDNLISLCASCHRRVEMGSLSVPADAQELADRVWSMFIDQD
jgi:HNH endonuclease